MSESSPEMEAQPEIPQLSGERWLAARGLVRRFVAERLGGSLADELLPIVGGESAIAPLPNMPRDTFFALGQAYPTLLATTQRKQRGTWYTPTELAEPTVARTLGPLLASHDDLRDASLRVCDPAAGGGTFLVSALRYLQNAGVPTTRAALCLHGVDVDSTAAVLAALAVFEACGEAAPDPRAIAANIRGGDGLLDRGGLAGGSFDAVLTNPPWETLQATDGAAKRVAALRPCFQHQGAGKLYTYRLFLERTHQLLREGGRFGLIVPASLWFDRDAEALRRLLLEQCSWEWLFGFENKKKLFAIDSRYRFAVIVGSKGGRTVAVKTAFGRTEPAQWAAAEPEHVDYDVRQLRTLSPRHWTFLECENDRDLAILERMVANGRPLIGLDGAFAWRQGDFNMTSDRAQFTLRSEAEARGFVRDDSGVWRCDRGEDTRDSRTLPIAAFSPLYQGAMIYDLHPNTGAHRDGTGHKTTWETPRDLDDVRPLYLVDAERWLATAASRPPARIVLRALSNATNERTAIACLLPDVPCGNSIGVLTPRETVALPLRTMAAGAAVLGSLPFDWALRRRLTGTNLNGFVLADCVMPRLDSATEILLARFVLQLCAVLPWHDALWLRAAEEGWSDASLQPVVDRDARCELLAAIDTAVGRAFGLCAEDAEWITADAGPRGFRRVDRDLPPARRRPARWLSAARMQ